MNRFWQMADLSERVNDTSARVCTLARGATRNWKGGEVPFVASNLRQGMNVRDFLYGVATARAAGFAKIAATPACGYLSRRLIAAMRDIYVQDGDCGADLMHCDIAPMRICTACTKRAGLALPDGYALGVVAAQALGEISTQKSMKLKHQATTSAISAVEGYKDVEHLFELRGVYSDIRERFAEEPLDTLAEHKRAILELLPVSEIYVDTVLYSMTMLNIKRGESVTMSNRADDSSWSLNSIHATGSGIPSNAARLAFGMNKRALLSSINKPDVVSSKIEGLLSGQVV